MRDHFFAVNWSEDYLATNFGPRTNFSWKTKYALTYYSPTHLHNAHVHTHTHTHTPHTHTHTTHTHTTHTHTHPHTHTHTHTHKSGSMRTHPMGGCDQANHTTRRKQRVFSATRRETRTHRFTSVVQRSTRRTRMHAHARTRRGGARARTDPGLGGFQLTATPCSHTIVPAMSSSTFAQHVHVCRCLQLVVRGRNALPSRIAS